MTRPQIKPTAAMAAMGANRNADQRAKEMADLIQLCRDSATRVVELTELVADLRDRVEQLEGAH